MPCQNPKLLSIEVTATASPTQIPIRRSSKHTTCAVNGSKSGKKQNGRLRVAPLGLGTTLLSISNLSAQSVNVAPNLAKVCCGTVFPMRGALGLCCRQIGTKNNNHERQEREQIAKDYSTDFQLTIQWNEIFTFDFSTKRHSSVEQHTGAGCVFCVTIR